MEDINIKEFQKEAYVELYIIENMLRLSVHSYYIENHGNGYFNDKIIPSYIDGKSIVATVIDRIKEAKENDEITDSDDYFFWFLDLRVLIEIINHNWEKDIKYIFNKNVSKVHIVQLLNDIKNTRNAIAHNRPINQEKWYELVTIKKKIFELLRNKYMKNIDLLLEEDNRIIYEKFSQIVINILRSIENLDPIKRDDINELYVCYIHFNDFNHEDLIEQLKEYNSIPKYSDNGKLANEFIRDNQLSMQLKNIINRK